jgi:hypothetical protein
MTSDVVATLLKSDKTYDHVSFSDMQLIRGRWECVACGAMQADYVLPGSENVLTCGPCPACGQEDKGFYVRELIGRVHGKGPEINLQPIYDRDIRDIHERDASRSQESH